MFAKEERETDAVTEAGHRNSSIERQKDREREQQIEIEKYRAKQR